jgi:hypothetical protein
MKHYWLGLGLLFSLTAHGQTHVIVIDNFERYTARPLIQKQNSAWSRYGNATDDGIESIDGGFSGRGAAYVAAWTDKNTTGSVRYTFPTLQNLLGTAILTVEMRVKPSPVKGTLVTALVSNGPTTYEISQAQDLSNARYTLYSFNFANDSVNCIEGTDTLQTVLSGAKSLTLKFTNTSGGGAQSIDFDDWGLTSAAPAAVPSP